MYRKARCDFKLKKKISCILLYLALFIIAFSGCYSVSGKNTYQSEIQHSVFILKNQNRKIAIDEVVSDAFQKEFTSIEDAGKTYNVNNFIVTWGKVIVENNLPYNQEVILKDNFMSAGRSITLYEKTNGQYQQKQSIDKINRTFHITILSHEVKELYFKCIESYTYGFDFDFLPFEVAIQKTKQNYSFYGLFLGIIVIMVFYNLFLFNSFRDLSYLYYIIFILAYGSVQLMMSNIFFEFLISIKDVYVQTNIFCFIRSIAAISFALFAITILDLKKFNPTIKKLLLGICVVITAGTIVTMFVKFYYYEIILTTPFLLIFIIVFFIGFRVWLNGYRPAKYFVIATSFFVVGTLLHPLGFWDAAPFTIDDLSKYKVLDISGLGMIFLFSLALSDRINIIQNEREFARTQAIDNLKHADKLKDEFLSNTSHELRTPLNGIIGLAESLADGAKGKIPEEARRDLQLIVASGRRLTSLVNDILDFSLLKNKDITLQLKQVDLATVIDTIITITTPLIRNKNLELINKVASNMPFLLADENRLQQILYNLVGNALKFTQNGSVTISAEYETTMCIISVADTGIGIPQKALSIIFNAFEQGDSSISRQYGGTGIGLAITRQLATLHGGVVSVKSKEGEGAVFSFTIPLYTEDAAREALVDQILTETKKDDLGLINQTKLATVLKEKTYEEAITPHEEMKTADSGGLPVILIVDDDEVNLQVLENMLILNNYVAIKVLNGQAAIETVKKQVPDCILLDIMMPGMSGYEVARKLREEYSLFDLPIIMLTAKNMMADVVTGFESGANDYLSKPFNKTEMLTRVKTQVDLKRSVSESKKLLVIQDQLRLAREIQDTTIPKELPNSPHFDFAASYIPTDHIGGDFYSYHFIDEMRIAVMIVDVVGHGIPAALITFMVKVVFDVLENLKQQPDKLLAEMNRILYGNIKHLFLTAGYAYIDMEQRKILYSRAGHEPLLVYKPDKHECYEFRPRGCLIGLLPENNLGVDVVDIEPGDRIVMHTDCIVESIDQSGEVFGIERFKAFIGENQHLSNKALIESLLKELKQWTGNEQQFDDDFTMLVIDVN